MQGIGRAEEEFIFARPQRLLRRLVESAGLGNLERAVVEIAAQDVEQILNQQDIRFRISLVWSHRSGELRSNGSIARHKWTSCLLDSIVRYDNSHEDRIGFGLPRRRRKSRPSASPIRMDAGILAPISSGFQSRALTGREMGRLGADQASHRSRA